MSYTPCKPHVWSERLREALAVRDGWVCSWCRQPVTIWDEVDHVFPRSAGGGNRWDNLQLLHSRCNRLKSARVIDPGLERLTELKRVPPGYADVAARVEGATKWWSW